MKNIYYLNVDCLMDFFLRFYLFIHETHREKQRHRQREKQAPCREPDMGLDPGSPGSGPGLKAALNSWATGLPTLPSLKGKSFRYFCLLSVMLISSIIIITILVDNNYLLYTNIDQSTLHILSHFILIKTLMQISLFLFFR